MLPRRSARLPGSQLVAGFGIPALTQAVWDRPGGRFSRSRLAVLGLWAALLAVPSATILVCGRSGDRVAEAKVRTDDGFPDPAGIRHVPEEALKTLGMLASDDTVAAEALVTGRFPARMIENLRLLREIDPATLQPFVCTPEWIRLEAGSCQTGAWKQGILLLDLVREGGCWKIEDLEATTGKDH